jgi:hypothetical protein
MGCENVISDGTLRQMIRIRPLFFEFFNWSASLNLNYYLNLHTYNIILSTLAKVN